MRATYSPSIFGTHHIFSRQGLSSFSARRRRTVSRETLSCSVRRTISPASSSMVQRARPSGGREHAVATRSASLMAGKLAGSSGTGLLGQGLVEIAFHEAALGPVDGRSADAQALGDGIVRHSGIGSEQDLGALELAGCMPAAAQQGLELTALGFVQLDPVAYVHRASPLREAQMNRSCGDVRENLYRAAGSVPGLYRRLHPRPRPAPGRERYAAPLRGQPAVCAPDGAYAGAPRARPPPARRGAQHRMSVAITHQRRPQSMRLPHIAAAAVLASLSMNLAM